MTRLQVRHRILSLREYATQRDVALDEVEEFSKLQRVLEGAPTLSEVPADEGESSSNGDGREPSSFECSEGEPRRSEAFTSDYGIAYRPDPVEATFNGEESGSRPKESDRAPPQPSRYKDHFSSFSNLSLGDVLSSSSSATRRSGGPAGGEAEWSDERARGGEHQ